MKSRGKKQGTACRYAQQKKSLHAKKGKDRSKSRGRSNTQTVTLDGWMAHQNVSKQYLWVCDNKGKKVGEFMVEEKLTAEQLKEYILYCRKYPVKGDKECQ